MENNQVIGLAGPIVWRRGYHSGLSNEDREELVKRASDVAPELAASLATREQTDTTFVRQTRNTGDLVCSGGPAAAEGGNAVGRLRRVPSKEPLGRRARATPE